MAPFLNPVSCPDKTLERIEHWLEIPGPPVPWAAKQTSRKTGNRFIPARQEEATGRVIRVAKELLDAGGQPFKVGQPLAIGGVFTVKRPKGHWGTGRNAERLKPQFVGARPTGKPDLSNLLKLVEDGCVLAGLIPDDDQIVEFLQPLTKVYTESPEQQPSSSIRIRSLV